MIPFILRRLLHAIPLILLICLFSFFLIDIAPGDFLSQMSLDPQVSQQSIEAMRTRFGLDKPWYVQYFLWLKNVLLHLDFGHSLSYKVPVFSLIKSRLFNTLLLTLAAAFVTWVMAIPFGILAAWKRNTFLDRSLSVVSYFGLSMPEVLSALLLLFFAARSGYFPTGGMRSIDHEAMSLAGKMFDILHHLMLPALVLGIVPVASRMRQMRANLLEALGADYVTYARAKGLPERIVVLRHALRGALNPMVTLFGYTIASLLSGSLLVEVIMSWPGIGRLTVESLKAQDLYLTMGAVLTSSVMLILGNLLADLLLALLDPRIRER
ncbi:MAG: ABC transporter permease [Candidatus Glassbacteria bacterium]